MGTPRSPSPISAHNTATIWPHALSYFGYQTAPKAPKSSSSQAYVKVKVVIVFGCCTGAAVVVLQQPF